ncbi:hypothetical protein M404DRAFT_991244 [Pisolithus tinctorius Marx 270]|uniref:Uncharacterized protein n=1 Tax=Pisolithus tinctorius Marx 270 TaxID=870435 RepID=A0A0C3PY56_PISTI|nr:hypothetical protein M404DRAFT_991244 [Pisolithus tinctorius Marx 270]
MATKNDRGSLNGTVEDSRNDKWIPPGSGAPQFDPDIASVLSDVIDGNFSGAPGGGAESYRV